MLMTLLLLGIGMPNLVVVRILLPSVDKMISFCAGGVVFGRPGDISGRQGITEGNYFNRWQLFLLRYATWRVSVTFEGDE